MRFAQSKRWGTFAAVAGAVLAFQVGGLVTGAATAVAADDAAAAAKPSIKDVMKTAYKGKESLQAKVLAGTATDAQKKEFLALTDALAGQKAPKGEQAAFDAKVAALTKAAHAYVETGADVAAFKAAADCKACHSAHKGS